MQTLPERAAIPVGLFDQMQHVSRIPMRQMFVLMVGLAAAVAVGVGVWLWSSTPDYRVLYSNLSDRDGGAVVAALSQLNVPYKVAEGGGAILVPGAQVHDIRLRLASQGLPRGSNVGFELVDNQKFGATQFQEQINYQRGLEGELARTIQTLSAVAAARVHLAIPKPSVFLRDQQQPTASVVVTLHPGRELDRAQVNGIVHLVASSVPELSLDHVSIIDQNGGLLSRRRDASDTGLDPSQLSYVKQLEQQTIQRIQDILEPILGRNNARVQVTADVDFSRTEAVAETFRPNVDPKVAALRTQQTSQSTTQAGGGAQGIPGALSNQPPAGGTLNLDGKSGAPAASAGAAPVNARKDETTAYEVDKKIEHTKAPVGGVRRMTAAVVVNYRKQEQAGKVTQAALSKEEMEQINSLVREAMGFSEKRGDSLNVVNAPFNEPAKEVIPETPLWKQPDNVQMGKDGLRYLVFAGVIGFLFFGVVRPMWRQASIPQRVEVMASSAPAPTSSPSSSSAPAPNDALERARKLARDDPKIVATVVKTWVSKDE
ncbi:MAG: flagellar M-ring protein FliF [Pseudomonadota bacterium]|nr:flagellar M-ring protein FliF [Pseudomonadota bacterium]